MGTVILNPEQERLAADFVASGRYRDVSEVVAVAFNHLRRMEEERIRLLASVQEAEAEAERTRFISLEEALNRARAVVAQRTHLVG